MRPRLSDWRREALRTTLWVIPAALIAVAVFLFVGTVLIDRAAFHHSLRLPTWLNSGSPDAAREVLSAIAAAVITVVGVVFSITIVALTLTSTQFGPRMLRNFIRDRGTQLTLGAFVGTFVYTVLVLGAVGDDSRGVFVPHLSIAVALALTLLDAGVLIYFIHHIAVSIQLPQVMASIAGDLSLAIDTETASGQVERDGRTESGPSVGELAFRLDDEGIDVGAPASGYLQFVRYDTLVAIAAEADAVIQVLHRPGHFLVEGLPIARVWPPSSARQVSRALKRGHVTGPHRTLTQDMSFAIDQLVEIALRALSPAVNDTFTALTCIDWLGDALCKISSNWDPRTVHRDRTGAVRVIQAEVRYARLVARATEKIRQSSSGMPAVMIRQLESFAKVMHYTTSDEQRTVLLNHAAMTARSAADTVSEPADLADIMQRLDSVRELPDALAKQSAERRRPS
jgi:uncharacterized membrane protein